jgi:hypothetical protein
MIKINKNSRKKLKKICYYLGINNTDKFLETNNVLDYKSDFKNNTFYIISTTTQSLFPNMSQKKDFSNLHINLGIKVNYKVCYSITLHPDCKFIFETKFSIFLLDYLNNNLLNRFHSLDNRTAFYYQEIKEIPDKKFFVVSCYAKYGKGIFNDPIIENIKNWIDDIFASVKGISDMYPIIKFNG